VGGTLGIILLGVFAGTAINPNGAQGLIHGSGTFFGKQVAAGLGASAYAFLFTYGMLRLIELITPVRVSELAERGLDAAMHGESAYQLEEEVPLDTAAPLL
jgi:ammonium transporter, Amt family